MKASVKVLGFIKLMDLLDGKVLPFVAKGDNGEFWVIENDEVTYQNGEYVKEVTWLNE